MEIRVMILDDHEVVRRGLRELLEIESDIRVVSEATNAAEAVARVAATQPDVAVLDVLLPDGDGVEVCREIRSRSPSTRCLMLTSHADDEALLAAIVAGASGYLLKNVKGMDLVEAVRKVARGESLLDPSLTGALMEKLRKESPSDQEDERLAQLSPQEKKLLELLAEGLTNRQIADRMFLAEKTVKNYVSNLLAKLGMSRRTQAAVYAARLQERRKTAG
jgi:two-component system response regulator DevR